MLIQHFAWRARGVFGYAKLEAAVRGIEAVARAGGRWRPVNDDFRSIRRELGRAGPARMIPCLTRIIESGAIEHRAFRELMRTPKMQDFLNCSLPGVSKLREYAGQ